MTTTRRLLAGGTLAATCLGVGAVVPAHAASAAPSHASSAAASQQAQLPGWTCPPGTPRAGQPALPLSPWPCGLVGVQR